MPKEEKNIKTTPVVRGLKNIRKIKKANIKIESKIIFKIL